MEHLIYFAFNNNTRNDKFEHIQEYFKKDTPLFHRIHPTCYIKFKLLYKFIIIFFYSFQI